MLQKNPTKHQNRNTPSRSRRHLHDVDQVRTLILFSLQVSHHPNTALATKPSVNRRLRVFKRWMASHGVDYNTNALTFTDTAHDGISVIATRDLNVGEVVATIPKSACLTTKTTGASELIEESGLGGSLGMSVAVMYERSLRHHSRWAGYLQLLPESECLPLVWTLDEVDHLLRGTELHKVKVDKMMKIQNLCVL